MNYFRDVVLVTAARLQSWTSEELNNESSSVHQTSCDEIINNIVKCTAGMSSQEVNNTIIKMCY